MPEESGTELPLVADTIEPYCLIKSEDVLSMAGWLYADVKATRAV